MNKIKGFILALVAVFAFYIFSLIMTPADDTMKDVIGNGGSIVMASGCIAAFVYLFKRMFKR